MASTNFVGVPSSPLAVPQYISAPPNPQIAVGPDDILTIVNRTIARYPNPNAGDNSNPLVSNPYNNPPTSYTYLDTWVGIADLDTLCPTKPRFNSTCVIDNASVRYDQLQGRFVVLFTVTDLPMHISNFYLVVSKYATFNQGTTGTTQVFTGPIAPITGGTSTGGINSNWVRQIIPINVVLPGTASTVAPAPVVVSFCTAPKLGGDPGSAPPTNAAPTGPITTGCSNYYPTAARFGLDNDNIILTAPVLDQSQAPYPSAVNLTLGIQNTAQFPAGPYAGTRVVTVPKLAVYNGTAAGLTQPATCLAAGCGAVNLADDTATGTLTGCAPTNPATGCQLANPVPAPVTGTTGTNPIPPYFWEPDNLRGRALASFDANVSTAPGTTGVITTVDYLVGSQIADDRGAAPLGSAGTNLTNQILVQPITFSCPASAIYSGPSGVTFCGTAAGNQVADLPTLGTMNFSTGAITATPGLLNQARTLLWPDDPQPVGQMAANDGTSMTTNRLFVGDSRPQQVIFREGLLYMARAIRGLDITFTNALGTSTVMYDVVKAPQPGQGITETGDTANGSPTVKNLSTSISGVNIAAPTSALAVGMTVTAPGFPKGTTIASIDSNTQVTLNKSCANPTGITACGTGNALIFVGAPVVNPTLVLETQWFNGQNVPDPNGYGFYQPMYDVPANVISTGPVSPINLLPWLEKLFVGMTTGGTANIAGTFARNNPSLWDFRPGDDAYDTTLPYLDPYTGNALISIPNCVGTASCPVIPFGIRGGAATDPNDGSLWLYGEFARNRLASVPGPGQWGTSVANYPLSFPATDAYNNDNSYFVDVQPGTQFFTWIQIAKNVGIAAPSSTVSGTCSTGGNPPIIPPPAPGGSTGTPQTCLNFNPNGFVTRAEMARWVVLSQMDETQVSNYLCATGGDPSGLAPCGGSTPASSFADTLSGINPVPGATTQQLQRYIEVMYRRGYTKGCALTSDAKRYYCPNDLLRRDQMSAFLIRAKMNNVFPTTLSGIPLSSPYGDNFGLFQASTPYFSDVPSTNDFFIYVQKMRELRITNGTTMTTYGASDNLTRAQIATFVVRAFFL